MTLYTKQPSSKDGRISSLDPTTNYGSETFLLTQATAGANKQRGLLQFNISDYPPGRAMITAKLKLYYGMWWSNDPAGRRIWAYKLKRTDWVEAQFTWNIYKTGSNWTTPGGDYVTSDPSGGSVLVPVSTGVWMEWDIKAIVEDAIENVSSMVELLIRDASETGQATTYDPSWLSKDHGTAATRPKIEIEHTPLVVAKPYGFVV